MFFPCGNSVKMLREETERLKVVLGQLVKQFLELEHSSLTVLCPVYGNHTLVQIYTHKHVGTYNSDNGWPSQHVIGNTSNI